MQRYAKLIRGLTRERNLVSEGMPYRVATRDGVQLEAPCNIDMTGGAHDLADAGFAGVGLFRTEFLYIGRKTPPDENMQSATYSELLKAFGTRPVVIRTMDFGADKFDDRVSVHRETNPVSGCGRSGFRSSAKTCSARSYERSCARRSTARRG